VLIAHLGDIKLRELATVMKELTRGVKDIRSCFITLLEDWFSKFKTASIKGKNSP